MSISLVYFVNRMLDASLAEWIWFLIALSGIFYFCFFRPGTSLAPWVPTKIKDVSRVNQLAALQPGETFVEVGCGDARVAAYIAKKNPDVQVIGIELSPPLFLVAKIHAWVRRFKNLEIVYADALRFDLTSADVVYVYGLNTTVNQKLLPKLDQELKSSARFISYAFPIEGEGVEVVSQDEAAKIFVKRY